jgi:hypothetical protein
MSNIMEKFLIKILEGAGSLLTVRSANPVSPSSDHLLIGRASHFYQPNQEETIYLSTEERLRHTYIIGASGSGKTRLLEHLVRQDIMAGRGFGLVDVHGDLAESILSFIAGLLKDGGLDAREKYISRKLILIEPFNQEWTVGFNPLAVKGIDSPYTLASEVIGILQKHWPDTYWGPRMEELLRNTLITLSVNGLTLLEAKLLLTDSSFRQRMLAKVPSGEVKEYWLLRYNALSESQKAIYREPLLNRVSVFVTEPAIRAMIGQAKSIDFRAIIDHGKWLLVNLSKGRLKGNADLLGALIVAKLQLAALSRVDVPEARRTPFTLFVDEFQNLATEDFQTILSEARKYGLGMVLAHQNIDQLDHQLRAAILGNTLTQIFFRLSNQDAATLASEFSQKEKPIIQRRLVDLKTREAYFKKKGDRPRLMRTFYVGPPEGTAKAVELVRNLSFPTYARPRKAVEEEITRRTQMILGQPNPVSPVRKAEDPYVGRFAPTEDFEEGHAW